MGLAAPAGTVAFTTRATVATTSAATAAATIATAARSTVTTIATRLARRTGVLQLFAGFLVDDAH